VGNIKTLLIPLVLKDIELGLMSQAHIRACVGLKSTRVTWDTPQQLRLIQAILEALRGVSIKSNIEVVQDELTVNLEKVGSVVSQWSGTLAPS